MECGKVRDRFSSLLERELNPLEGKMVKEHLHSCPECQKDLERFKKTIHWLHSVEDVEVPDGFLSGIYKKAEDRKRKALLSEKSRWRWFSYPPSLKLPIQAAAMVSIVFLVIYLTKIMPVETFRLKGIEKTKPSISEEKRSDIEAKVPLSKKKEMDRLLILKETEQKRVPAQPPPETPRQKDIEEVKVSAAGEKPPQEIILKTPNRGKALSQIQEMVKRFRGEIITAEGNVILASLSVASFSGFERELLSLSSSTKAEAFLQKSAKEAPAAPVEPKKREEEGKIKEPPSPIIGREDRLIVRILLLQE